MKTILVTGAAGFIGSHLVEALLARGDRVAGLDNFEPAYDPALKRANLAQAITNPGFRLFEADIRDAVRLGRFIPETRPDVVIHLAARVGAREALADPEGFRDVNVNGTREVVAAGMKAGAGVVVASSASVYGSGPGRTRREDMSLAQPSDPYAASKWAAERTAFEEAGPQGDGLIVLRLASTYGPRQRPGTGLDTFADRLVRGETVPVFGDGARGRELVFVADVVRAFLTAADRIPSRDIMNIGSGRSVRILDVVTELARALGVPAKPALVPPPPGYGEIGVMDDEKARRGWAFEPRVSLNEGLALYASWYRQQGTGGNR